MNRFGSRDSDRVELAFIDDSSYLSYSQVGEDASHLSLVPHSQIQLIVSLGTHRVHQVQVSQSVGYLHLSR